MASPSLADIKTRAVSSQARHCTSASISLQLVFFGRRSASAFCTPLSRNTNLSSVSTFLHATPPSTISSMHIVRISGVKTQTCLPPICRSSMDLNSFSSFNWASSLSRISHLFPARLRRCVIVATLHTSLARAFFLIAWAAADASKPRKSLTLLCSSSISSLFLRSCIACTLIVSDSLSSARALSFLSLLFCNFEMCSALFCDSTVSSTFASFSMILCWLLQAFIITLFAARKSPTAAFRFASTALLLSELAAFSACHRSFSLSARRVAAAAVFSASRVLCNADLALAFSFAATASAFFVARTASRFSLWASAARCSLWAALRSTLSSRIFTGAISA